MTASSNLPQRAPPSAYRPSAARRWTTEARLGRLRHWIRGLSLGTHRAEPGRPHAEPPRSHSGRLHVPYGRDAHLHPNTLPSSRETRYHR